MDSSKRQRELFDEHFTDYWYVREHLPQTSTYWRTLYRHLIHLYPLAGGNRVLEPMCGQGILLKALAEEGIESFGLDISWELIKRGPRGVLVLGDAVSLPFKDNIFDYLFVVGGVHHLTTEQMSLAAGEFKRVLKKGGLAVLLEPNNLNPVALMLRKIVGRIYSDRFDLDEVSFDYREMNRIFADEGFKDCKVWPLGYAAYGLFAQTDVAVFLRPLRFIPGIRTLVRHMVKLDFLMGRVPLLNRLGFMVVSEMVCRKTQNPNT